MTTHHRPGDHNCQYRSLYEGSQASLTDMAGQQAVALARLGRVRMGIVETLKRVFPREFSSAEAALGGRLSGVDDEVLLAYVNAFCLQLATTTSGPPAGLDQLRGALTLAGFQLPQGTDLREWAGAISARPQPAAAPAGATPVPAVGTLPAAPSPAPAPTVTGQVDDLAALFGEDPDWGAPLIFDDEQPAAALDLPVDPYADIPADVGTVPAWPDIEIVPAPTAAEPTTDAALAAAVEPPVATAMDPLPVVTNLDVYTSAPAWPELAPVASPAAMSAPDPGPVTPAVPAPAVAVPAPAAPSPDAAQAAAAAAAATTAVAVPGLSQPLRPTTLFPTAGTTKTRRRRTPRVSATAPAGTPDVPFQAAADFAGDADLESKILASVAIPRPVFIADLAALTGSMESAEAWEKTQRGRQDTPLRFVSAKTRHRARGSLVLPHDKELRQAATGFEESSWWAEAMACYRGAKLYELAVLLHAVGDQVVGHTLTSDLAVLRLNTKSGLVGVVVVLDQKLGAGEKTRAALAEAVEGLLRERLTMLAVLATDDGTLTKVQEALVAEKEDRGWQPATMVVAGRSWAYAANPGGSVQAVFS